MKVLKKKKYIYIRTILFFDLFPIKIIGQRKTNHPLLAEKQKRNVFCQAFCLNELKYNLGSSNYCKNLFCISENV